MTATIECEAGFRNGWVRNVWRIAAVVILAALASCGLNLNICAECEKQDLVFYDQTWLIANPSSITVDPGQDASAMVTVGAERGIDDPNNTHSRQFQGVSVVPPTPGVTLTRNLGACTTKPSGQPVSDFGFCATFQLNINAAAISAGVRDVTLSAIWFTYEGALPFPRQNFARTIERVETFRVSVTSSPPAVAPDFQVAVGASTSGVYGTRATLPVSITRIGGFAEDVTLAFNGLSSGLVGSFAIEPMPTDRRNLELQIPARYAGGGQVDLRITATATAGRQKVLNFSLFIDPLFRLGLLPAAATLTAASPLRIEVSLAPGQALRSPSIGTVELSISPSTPLPEGVTATFLEDAVPVVPELPVQAVTRTLLLVSDGVHPGVMGPLQIRGTAAGVPRDPDGALPFIETTLALTTVQGQSWQFVAGNLAYGVTDAEAVGLALQGNDRPAVAWLQGRADRVAYLRRFDGTTFAPSPSGAEASPLRAPSGGIDEARFALSGGDVARIAFTYGGGAAMALGSSGATWTVGAPLVVGDPANAATPRARSPRIATGPANTVVVSYIREADAASSGGELQVVQSSNGGPFAPMPGPGPGGALNVAATGKAVRNASALAVRADGRPWVAWVEQPADPATAARLWLRAHDGAAWGAAIEAPTPGTPVGPSLQLLVEPSGMVVVAWLEGSPARVKLMRYDPASQTWTALNDTRNGRGSLNITAFLPALDMHLSRQPDGRLLVAWTEGGADPRVWIKRQEADGSWVLVGTTVSPQFVWSKTPFLVGDTSNRLHVAWAQHLAGRGPETPAPEAGVHVAQWIGQ